MSYRFWVELQSFPNRYVSWGVNSKINNSVKQQWFNSKLSKSTATNLYITQHQHRQQVTRQDDVELQDLPGGSSLTDTDFFPSAFISPFAITFFVGD